MTILRQLPLFLWELPQNTLGAALLSLGYLTRRVRGVTWERNRLFVEMPATGVSLGLFVFWTNGDNPYVETGARTKAHEYGHTFQSRLLGPLYLPLVGVPSVSRVIYSIVHYHLKGRSWTGYYDGYPENWADRLGGVERRKR